MQSVEGFTFLTLDSYRSYFSFRAEGLLLARSD